jgi:hypothetical protein
MRRKGPVGILIAALMAAACGGTTTSPRPSPSLVDLEFTPLPTTTSSSPSPSTSAVASDDGRPEGWEAAFCTMFAEARVAQELLVDIERALAEGDLRDARGLARELRQVAQNATVLIDEIPTWEDAGDVLLDIATLLDLGGQAAVEYDTYVGEDSRPALRRARGLGRENGQGVPATNTALEDLASAGVECPDGPLRLESP